MTGDNKALPSARAFVLRTASIAAALQASIANAGDF